MGWGRASDATTLTLVLEVLAPKLDLSPATRAPRAVWPDISGYPDFAPEMAWLSYTLGELAKRDSGRAKRCGELASMLGFPSRLQKHLERDEYWFWLRETQLGKRAQ